MALLAQGTLQNVYQSLDAYLQTWVVDSMGLALQAHGQRRFVPPEDAAWVTADYSMLTINRRYRRQIGGTVVATEVSGTLSLYLYRHMRVYTLDYVRDLTVLRDSLVGHFPEAGSIPIYDYTQVSGTPPSIAPQVATLYIESVSEQLMDMGAASGLLCWEVRPTLLYLEEATR